MKSLTEEILRQMYIEKWDGELPEVMSDGAGIYVGLGGAPDEKGAG